jgi:hypothetical protein
MQRGTRVDEAKIICRLDATGVPEIAAILRKEFGGGSHEHAIRRLAGAPCNGFEAPAQARLRVVEPERIDQPACAEARNRQSSSLQPASEEEEQGKQTQRGFRHSRGSAGGMKAKGWPNSMRQNTRSGNFLAKDSKDATVFPELRIDAKEGGAG